MLSYLANHIPALKGTKDMQNNSKTQESRFWKRWYASGAVTRQQFPAGALKIDAIGIHHAGAAKGYSVLGLGQKRITPHSYVSICCVVVPTSNKHELGVTLPRIPGNAVPVDIFFAK